MSKNLAVQLVNKFALISGGTVWPNINKAVLVSGMIARVQSPNLINQEGTPLCGPATLARSLAIDKPLLYVKSIIELYKFGETRINNFEIKAGSELRLSSVQGNTNPADWILLASIRDSDNWFLSPAGWLGNSAAGITLPGDLESWFTATGYTKIINKTHLFVKPSKSVLIGEAMEASSLYIQGYKVLLLIDADMLNSQNQDDKISLTPNHWVVLNSMISGFSILNTNSSISFLIYTWGRTLRVPRNFIKPLTVDDFLHKYYGFIAAKF